MYTKLQKSLLLVAGAGGVALLAVMMTQPPHPDATSDVTTRLLSDVNDGTNWPGYGRTFDEGHYSPLTDINDKNVARLGLAWAFDLPTSPSTVGAPLAIDGIVYFGVGFSIVRAVEASSGKLLWTYDPHVPEVAGDKLQKAWGIRGIAYAEGKIITGTQDGRLIAIDAVSGTEIWTVQTTEGPNDGRYITGAPRIFRDMVIIGHGGADSGNVRGYVTAYDVRTGKQRWRFYTVPGNPALGFENEAMARAAKTWTGEWWKYGGGGTAWNAMTYDPELDRIYIGTGNGAPWDRTIRSPGGGDNLYLCSIVALDAKTGKYVWHYQTTPGESWDYNSAQDITLATLSIGGKPRRVILHAPKNGFFYVIDRDSGKLISAEPFVKTTWASKIDLATGRPIENASARAIDRPALVYPGSAGAHAWQAQSFNPRTGLVYLPVHDVPALFEPIEMKGKTWVRTPGFNSAYQPTMFKGVVPSLSPTPVAYLLAWDPIAQRKRWAVPLPGMYNGGAASTGGNLVFQGNSGGTFAAYAADTGKILWSFAAQNGVIGQPITYKSNGRQYVTVITGMGGAAGIAPVHLGWDYREQKRRVLTFTLDGKAVLPPMRKSESSVVLDPSFRPNPVLVDAGNRIYGYRCMTCHGMGVQADGTAPDLRKSGVPLDAESFADVVTKGPLISQGMPRFADLAKSDVEALRHYIRYQAAQSGSTNIAKR